MTKVGRPPILRIGHQGMQILDDGVQVEGLERLGIVEPVVHRVGPRRMLAECAKVQLLWPPVTVAPARAAACKRALARALVVGHLIHTVPPVTMASSAPPATSVLASKATTGSKLLRPTVI